MKHATFKIGIASLGVSLLVAGGVCAQAANNSQVRIAAIISKGDQEITRRLAELNKLDGKINSTARLTTADKTTLTAQVNTEITGLTALKTKLDADTTITAAHTDAVSILTEYRVYAL